MLNKAYFLLAFLFVSVNAGIAQTNIPVRISQKIEVINEKSYYIHTVQKGHTMYSISKVYDVPITEIEFENPETREGLKIGQFIKIPLVTRADQIEKEISNTEYEYFYHVAKASETFDDIAEIYVVGIENLMLANPETSEPFNEGEYIKIPVAIKVPIKPFHVDKPEYNPVINFARDDRQKRQLFDSLVNQTTTDDRANDNKVYQELQKHLVPLQVKEKSENTPDSLLKITPANTDIEEQEAEKGIQIIDHKVEKGETLYRIAAQYKVSLDTLISYNPGLSSKIKPGQVIQVPKKKSISGYINHTVEKRERLNRIAKKYDVSEEVLRELNPYISSKPISGQIIKIPVEKDRIEEIPPDTAIVSEIKPLDDFNMDSLICIQSAAVNQGPFNVALMMPLYLSEADSIDITLPIDPLRMISQKPFRFLQFYYGILMAIDSIQQTGLQIDLYVFDVDKDISKTIEVFQDHRLSNMDLIIGPFYPESFEIASNFAKIFDIKIINPLSFRSEITTRNHHVIKFQPDLNSQINLLSEAIGNHFPDDNIILVKHNEYEELERMNQYSGAIEPLVPESVALSNLDLYNYLIECSSQDSTLGDGELLESIKIENRDIFLLDIEAALMDSTRIPNNVSKIVYSIDSIYGIEKYANPLRNNVIITLSENWAFVKNFITELNLLRDTFDITLIGIPRFGRFDDRGEDQIFLNLNTHLFLPAYIDFEEKETKDFIFKYRYYFNAEPQAFAYTGFDIGWYFFNALARYGKDFDNCLPYFQIDLLQQNTNFIRHHEQSGLENTDWGFYKYDDYEIKAVEIEKKKDEEFWKNY